MNGKQVIIGQKYGRLIPLKLAFRDKKGIKHYKVRCACGTEKVLPGYRFNLGRTKSCGCLIREVTSKLGKLARHAPGEAAKRLLYYTYGKDAKRRHLAFKITRKQFLHLIQQRCHYCGLPPSNMAYPKRYFGGVTYTGLDRLNSNKGYLPNNVVPCCRKRNLAKGTTSVDEFYDWIKRAYAVSILKDTSAPKN